MKPTKYILILLSLFLISNCGDKVREEIVERYDNGQKKVLVEYKGKGSDEEIVKRIEYYVFIRELSNKYSLFFISQTNVTNPI